MDCAKNLYMPMFGNILIQVLKVCDYYYDIAPILYPFVGMPRGTFNIYGNFNDVRTFVYNIV